MSQFDHRNLDNVIHSRIRLAAMALLASLDEAEFTFLRDQLGTTDGNLVTHLRKLESAGYLEARKRDWEGRATTAYRLSEAGRDAFAAYVERLGSFLPKG